MKILITTQIVDQDSPLLGFFLGWIKEFAKYFDEVHVICLQKGKYDLPDNVFVYSLGKEEGESDLKYIVRFYKYFWRIFFKVRVDHVFFHMGAIYNIMAAPFFFVRKFYRTKFSWWKTHGHINLIGRIALLFVDNVYTAIGASFSVRTKKKRVVGHAIDTDLFTYVGKEAKENKILFIGRFSRSKRLEQVIEITNGLVDAGVPVSTKLIGQVTDKPYYEEIKSMVKELGLEGKVEFVEGLKHEELVAEYQKASLFINPSDNDGLDKVVLEAMLSGTIPLTANRSFAEVLDKHGLYMQKGDIEGYIKTAKSVFDMDESAYNELAVKLRETVIADHALKTLTQRIFDL